MIGEYVLKASLILVVALIGLGCAERNKPVEMRSVQQWLADPDAANDAVERCIWRSGHGLQDDAERKACDAVFEAIRKS